MNPNPDGSQAFHPEHTRERLIRAAEALFARKGYARTSIRDITREASCNVAAVNYHFATKHNLYREMLTRRIRALRERRVSSLERTVAETRGKASLEEVLGSFAEAFLEPLVDEPSGRMLMELMTRELLDPQLPPDFFLSEMILPVEEALTKAILAAQTDVPRRKVRMCVHSFVAQLIHLVKIRRLVQLASQGKPLDFSLPELVSHIVQFTSAGIRAYREGSGQT